MLPAMPALRDAVLRLCAPVFCLSFIGASCGPSAVGLLPGVLNDSHNRTLRRALLNIGMGQICEEIRSRSMPLRLADEEPVAGRFFPTACTSRELPTGELYVQLGGHGYVWTDRSLRLGFEASVAVAYDIDFLIASSGATYVYFRAKASSAPTFITRLVEESQVSMFNRVFGVAGQRPTDGFGAQVMGAQIVRGFTVVRDPSGGTEFGVGIVPPGTRPQGGFLGLDHDHPILANERVEVHQNQRDFAGPFVVPEGKQLGLMINETGAAALDVLLVPRAAGDAWLAAYTHDRAATPPPVMPLLDDVVPLGTVYRRTLRLPPGAYYLVLDNTATAGRTSPPVAPRDDRPVVVSYAVDLQ